MFQPPQRATTLWRLAAGLALLIVLVIIWLALPGGSITNVGGPLAVEAAAGPSTGQQAASGPFGVYMVGIDQGGLVGGQEMADAGVQWIQIYLPWRQIETSPGVYDWTQADALFDDIATYGFKVIVYVTENPAFAADTVCGPIKEDQLQTFADFLSAAVSRYSVAPYNALYWQLYNEPDNSDAINYNWLGGCWGRTHPNHADGAGGAAYANMLKTAYPGHQGG